MPASMDVLWHPTLPRRQKNRALCDRTMVGGVRQKDRGFKSGGARLNNQRRTDISYTCGSLVSKRVRWLPKVGEVQLICVRL